MKNIVKFLIFSLTILILFEIKANAEFLCQAEILYKWSSQGAQPAVSQDTKQPKPEATVAAASELSVFWANIEQKGQTEEEAKAKVNKLALSERASAERACLAAHENLSGCIASKYAALTGSVSTLGFSARKSIEDAISSDCQKQQGKCSGSSVGEIKCGEVITAAKSTEPPAKDAKGKKK